MALLLQEKNNSLSKYIEEISAIPVLTEEEEHNYAVLKENGDLNAAKILINSHLRLVVKIAMKYKNYGLSLTDLIAEGNLGLMRAVREFSVEKGCKLATYAMWWIKANIQEYILKNWSLIKIGTTLTQKKLFFNLRKIKAKILSEDKKYLSNNDVKEISKLMNIDEKSVIELDNRLSSRDISLNQKAYSQDDESQRELGDLIKSKELPPDVLYEKRQTRLNQIKLLKESFSVLNDREKAILLNRKLTENPMTLQELSEKYGVSMERVRQIEEQAVKKIQNFILTKSK